MESGGVAVGLATISVVLAAVVFAGENALTGPIQFIERYFGLFARRRRRSDGNTGSRSAGGACRSGSVSAGDEMNVVGLRMWSYVIAVPEGCDPSEIISVIEQIGRAIIR